VALIGRVPNILVLNPELGINSLEALIRRLKYQPDHIAYGTAGNGTALHMAAALFSVMADVRMLHVPYQGSAPAMQDLLSGQIDGLFDPVTTNVAQLKAGSLRALAISTPARLPALGSIPTFAEAGFPSMTGSQWLGLSGPKNLPAPIVQRLTALVPEILRKPDIAARLEELQTLPRRTPVVGDEFVKVVRSQIDTWTGVAKKAKVEVAV
jgi:tripartite-type tricarboxylate transporter receptor subunit TctC